MNRFSPTATLLCVLAVIGPACNCGTPQTGSETTGVGTGNRGPGLSGSGTSSGGTTGAGTSGSTTSGMGCGLRTCASAAATCGPIGDGCGNVLQCGSCTAPESCGGGGVPSVCGGDAGLCPARTCATEHATCGPISDGCGNLLQCGECDAGSCGGAGVANACGVSTDLDGGDLEPDGGCRPLTCAQQGVQCGPAGDGCGNVLQCGACDAGTCGGDGVLGVCGQGCTPTTCTSLSIGCGAAGDGCGNLLDCGGCDAGACGGAGVPGQCGVTPACVRLDCFDAGASCGYLGDGCGGQIQCGTCALPDICGGGGVPFVCGDGSSADGGACLAPLSSCNTASGSICTDLQTDPSNCGTCGNLCGTGLVCSAGVCTAECSGSLACNADAGDVCVGDHCANACDVALTGTSSEGCEFWPLHLWNTEDGSSCGSNENQPCFRGPLGIVASNSAGTSTATVTLEDEDGEAIIGTATIPPGSAHTFDVPNSEDALNQTMSGSSLHLRSNVPIAAYEFNPVDATAAFSSGASLLLPTHTLAQNYYALSYTYADVPGLTPALGQGYLAVVGTQPNTSVTVQVPVLTLASADGTIPALNPNATYGFTLGRGQALELTQALDGGDISGAQISADKPIAAFGGSGATTVPGDALGGDHFEVQLFPTAAWGTSYECEKYQPRAENDVDHWRVVAGVAGTTVTLSDPTIATIPTLGPGDIYEFSTAESFDLTASQPVSVAHYLEAWGNFTGPLNTTLYPNPTTNACPSAGGPNGSQCIGDANMALVVPTAQYLTEYTFYTPAQFAYNYVDVLAPVSATVVLDGTTTATLTAIGSGAYGLDRMSLAAGNHSISGNAPFGIAVYGYDYGISYSYPGGLDLKTIGFTGNPATCTSLTCAQQGYNCGPAGDGCGNLIDGGCGVCTSPDTCGGSGMAGVCGTNCQPRTCAQLGLACGPAGDGCGNVIQCGGCDAGTCGGGGTPGVCGAITCQPRTCASLGDTCGPAGDGCGGLIDGGCGVCLSPETCGGGGTPGQCGSDVGCSSLTCQQQGLSCGPAGDGCGNVIQCGACDAGTCGGGGVVGVCGGPSCNKLTCAALGYNCGPAGDGCGGLLECGECDAGTCGGSFQPNVCGLPSFE